MRTKHKRLIGLLAVLAILAMVALGFLVWKATSGPRLFYDEGRSSFDDFTIQDGKVYLRCALTLRNDGNTFGTFRIRGDFSDDQAGGLLQESLLTAQREDGAELFSIDAHSSLEYITVIFVGTHGSADTKQDRNLPKQIVLEPVQNP